MITQTTIAADVEKVLAAEATVTEKSIIRDTGAEKLTELEHAIKTALQSEGDPVDLARVIAPQQVELSIRKTRQPVAVAEADAAAKAFAATCRDVCRRLHRYGQDVLTEKGKARSNQLIQIWDDWGLPEYGRINSRVILTLTGDALQPHRDLINELSAVSEHGESLSSASVISLIRRCALWATPETETT